jgi:hypothetical protein
MEDLTVTELPTRHELREMDQTGLDALLADVVPEPAERRVRRERAAATLRRGLDCGAFKLGPGLKIILNTDSPKEG